MFKYTIKTKVTIKYYERRLKKIFDFIEFETTELSIEVRCYKFAVKSKINLNWTLSHIIRFLLYQKENG